MKKHINLLYQLIFSLIIVCLALGQLQRWQLTSDVAIYGHDVLIFGFILVWGVNLVISRSKVNLITRLEMIYALAAWLVCTWLINSVSFGIISSMSGLLYLLRWIMYLGFGMAIYDLLTKRVLAIRPIKWLFRIGLLAAFLGIGQYIFWPDTRILYTFGWDDHLNRLIGTYFDPGFTGLMFILALILGLVRKNYLAVGLFLVATLLTYSRASMLTLLIILLIWTVKTRELVIGSSWLIVSLILVLMLPQTAGEGVKLARTQSVTARITSTVSGLEIFTQNPIWGIGFNNYRLVLPQSDRQIPSHTSSPDNSYIFLLATAGLFGLGLFIASIGGLWLFSWQESAELFLSIVAISIHAMFNNTWFYPFVLIWFWILLASVMARSKINEPPQHNTNK